MLVYFFIKIKKISHFLYNSIANCKEKMLYLQHLKHIYSFMGQSSNINPLKRLQDLVSLDKKEIASVYFYAVLAGFVQLSVPIGIQSIIGFVLGASMVTSIYVLIVLVVIGVLAGGSMQINQMKITEKIQQRIFARYAFEFAEKIPSFDLKKIDKYYLPEKVNRFFEVLTIQKGLSKLLLDVPTATIQILFGLLLLASYNIAFIAFGFFLVVILWLMLKLTSNKGLVTSIEESNYKYAVVSWLQEMARVIKSFKYSQGTHFNLLKTDKNVVGYLAARTEHFKVLLFQYRILVFFKVGITASMLTIGIYLLLNQELNIGEFIAAEIVIITVINAVEKLITSLDGVYDVVTGLEKLEAVVESSLEKDGANMADTDLHCLDNGVSIEMIDLNFEYEEGKRILNKISLNIPANSTVCVSGQEGSGKSSFLKVLGTNYNDFTGAILFNKIPINNYPLGILRNKIGTYSNEQEIFLGTVSENINMGRNNISYDKITETAQKLGIDNFLDKLHNGFQTDVDATGRKFPSTVVKKILLLRAFVNDPTLLLLEEPWQGLERPTKNAMIDYIISKQHNATVVVASNDNDFAAKCDYHVYLTNGVATVIRNAALKKIISLEKKNDENEDEI